MSVFNEVLFLQRELAASQRAFNYAESLRQKAVGWESAFLAIQAGRLEAHVDGIRLKLLEALTRQKTSVNSSQYQNFLK